MKSVKHFIPPQGVERIRNLSLIPSTLQAKLLHPINQDQVHPPVSVRNAQKSHTLLPSWQKGVQPAPD